MKIKDNIAEEFDEFSKNYTNDMIGCVPFYLELMDFFTSELPKSSAPLKILDLGCGNGNVTSRLLNSFPKASFTLVDASREMLNICKQKFENVPIEYKETYFNDLILPKAEFDLVVAGFSMHHCTSKEKKMLFKKIFDTLKKAGLFMCSDLMISKKEAVHDVLLSKWEAFVNANYKDEEKWLWLKQHYDEFDSPDKLQDQQKWLQQIGFRQIKTHSFENYWTHFNALKP